MAFNAVVYTATNAVSVLMSDSWFFVETFLISYYERGLTLGSLLTKRSSVDHAAPVQKLILLADARLFDLDFRMEGLFSVFIAILTIALLGLVMKAASQSRVMDGWFWVAVSAITAIYLSMNATVVFDWPLVSLYFVVLLLVFAFFAAVAHALTSGRYWLAALAGFVCFVGADDIGLLALLSASAMIGLAWLRKDASASRAMRTLAAIGVAMLASRVLYAIYGGGLSGGGTMSTIDRLSALWALGIRGLADAGIVIASAPIVHRAQLPDAHGYALQVCVALAVLALHVWFWTRQWRTRCPTLLTRLAAAMMVFAYLLAGGILYGRVSQLGLDYLNAPRYVQFYGLCMVAIILQFHAAVSTVETRSSISASKGVLLGLSIALVSLQLHYINRAWKFAPFAAEYERNLALDIGKAADPRNVQPLQCLPHIVICRQPYAMRKNVVEFLQTRQLNVFSWRLQRLRRLYPNEAGQAAAP